MSVFKSWGKILTICVYLDSECVYSQLFASVIYSVIIVVVIDDVCCVNSSVAYTHKWHTYRFDFTCCISIHQLRSSSPEEVQYQLKWAQKSHSKHFIFSTTCRTMWLPQRLQNEWNKCITTMKCKISWFAVLWIQMTLNLVLN